MEERFVNQLVADSEGYKCEISMLLDRIHDQELRIQAVTRDRAFLAEANSRATKRIVKLTECVKFYADKDNYMEVYMHYWGMIYEDTEETVGKRARKVLAEIENECGSTKGAERP